MTITLNNLSPQEMVDVYNETIKDEQAASKKKAAADATLKRARNDKQAAKDALMNYINTHKGECVDPATGEIGKVIILPTPLDGHVLKISKRKNAPTVDIIDVNAVPDEYCKIERKPKLNEIKAAYKGAETLPNWLVFNEGSETINIDVVKA